MAMFGTIQQLDIICGMQACLWITCRILPKYFWVRECSAHSATITPSTSGHRRNTTTWQHTLGLQAQIPYGKVPISQDFQKIQRGLVQKSLRQLHSRRSSGESPSINCERRVVRDLIQPMTAQALETGEGFDCQKIINTTMVSLSRR